VDAKLANDGDLFAKIRQNHLPRSGFFARLMSQVAPLELALYARGIRVARLNNIARGRALALREGWAKMMGTKPVEFEFTVIGFSPDQLRLAESRRQQRIALSLDRREEAMAYGRRMPRLPKPFDREQYCSTHRPAEYCRGFASRRAALDVADLLRQHGWIEVFALEPDGSPAKDKP
jgi:hypothetical protein